jgi:myo-inositol-1(or 4)-monophosphatase
MPVLEQVVEQAAIEGGQILMGYFRRKQRIWAKSPFELVTEADMASEKAIISEIRQCFPEHTITSEEQGKLAGDADRVWIVDPLDGTLKFVLGEPYFSVSIAYEFRGVLEVAVIHNPYTGDIFFARRGRGAFKNGVALRIPIIKDLSTSLVCCDWGGSLQMQQQGLSYLSRFLPPVTRGIGVNFSPALDLCNLAEGNIAALISNGTTPEDHAAGALIVQEAGGHVINFGQTGWSPHRRGIVATSTPGIAGQVTRILHECAA